MGGSIIGQCRVKVVGAGRVGVECCWRSRRCEGLWGNEWGLAEDWGESDLALGVLHAGWLGDAVEVGGFDEAFVDVVVARGV